MGDEWLEIEVDRRSTLHGGGRLAGRLLYTSPRSFEVSGSTVELFWRTLGHADVSTGGGQAVEGGRASAAAGEELAIPFAFDVPQRPPSMTGTLLSVEWVLAARLAVPWARDPTTEHVVHIDAPPRDLASPAGYRGASREPRRERPRARARLGLGWVRNAVAGARLGAPVIEVPEQVLRGEALPVAVVITPSSSVHIGEVTASLTCTEITERTANDSTATKRLVEHEERLVLTGGEDVPEGVTASWTASFTIPSRVPASFFASSASFVWEVAVRIAVDGWPDHEEVFRVDVQP